MVGGGAIITLGLLLAIVAPWPALAAAGFALVGLGAANVVPVAFSGASRVPGMPSNLGVAAVTTMGYVGFLAMPPVLGFVAHLRPVDLDGGGRADGRRRRPDRRDLRPPPLTANSRQTGFAVTSRAVGMTVTPWGEEPDMSSRDRRRSALASACLLAMTATMTASAPARADDGPRLGTYKICQANLTSAVCASRMNLKEGWQYEVTWEDGSVRSRGEYSYDPGKQRVRWLSGLNYEMGRGGTFSIREGGRIHYILMGSKTYAINGDE